MAFRECGSGFLDKMEGLGACSDVFVTAKLASENSTPVVLGVTIGYPCCKNMLVGAACFSAVVVSVLVDCRITMLPRSSSNTLSMGVSSITCKEVTACRVGSFCTCIPYFVRDFLISYPCKSRKPVVLQVQGQVEDECTH